jgi:hypothetical protein
MGRERRAKQERKLKDDYCDPKAPGKTTIPPEGFDCWTNSGRDRRFNGDDGSSNRAGVSNNSCRHFSPSDERKPGAVVR